MKLADVVNATLHTFTPVQQPETAALLSISDRGADLLNYLEGKLAWEMECSDNYYAPYTNDSGKALLALYVSRVQQQLEELQQQVSEVLVEQANTPAAAAAAADVELNVNVSFFAYRLSYSIQQLQ
jgi:hypothetical protein